MIAGNLRKIFAMFFAALALAACATAPAPRIVTREVEIPVAVACAADPGPAPAYADAPAAVIAAGDIFERVKLLLAGRAERDARLSELGAALAGCQPP